ncbi:hypothetical protein PG989_005785 [Apiospora arundinis]
MMRLYSEKRVCWQGSGGPPAAPCPSSPACSSRTSTTSRRSVSSPGCCWRGARAARVAAYLGPAQPAPVAQVADPAGPAPPLGGDLGVAVGAAEGLVTAVSLVPPALFGALEQALQFVVQGPVGRLELVDLVRERAAPVGVETAQDVLVVVDAIVAHCGRGGGLVGGNGSDASGDAIWTAAVFRQQGLLLPPGGGLQDAAVG